MRIREASRGHDLDTLLQEHGGLDGLARELGQYHPEVYGAANDNNDPRAANSATILQRLRSWLGLGR